MITPPKAVPAVDRIASRPLPIFVPLGKPFQELFGIGRSTQAELIRRRELRSVLVGEVRGRRMIEVQSMLEYVERQRQREAEGKIGVSSPNPHVRQHKPHIRSATSAADSRAQTRRTSAPRARLTKGVR